MQPPPIPRPSQRQLSPTLTTSCHPASNAASVPPPGSSGVVGVASGISRAAVTASSAHVAALVDGRLSAIGLADLVSRVDTIGEDDVRQQRCG